LVRELKYGLSLTASGSRVYGNLYMTEKAGGEDFDADDERALSLLAAQAGAAIEAANLYEQANDRAQRLKAIQAISTAILAGTAWAASTWPLRRPTGCWPASCLGQSSRPKAR
jgi:GAF domain-containing protein